MTRFGFDWAQTPAEGWAAFRAFLRTWSGRPDYGFAIHAEPGHADGRLLPATVLTWREFARTVGQLDPPFGFRDPVVFEGNPTLCQFDLIMQAEDDFIWAIADDQLGLEQPAVQLQVYSYDAEWDDPAAWTRHDFADDVVAATLRYLQAYLESLGGSFARDEPLTPAEREALVAWVEPERWERIELFHRPDMLVISQPKHPQGYTPGLQIEFGPAVTQEAIDATPLAALMRTCWVRYNPLGLAEGPPYPTRGRS